MCGHDWVTINDVAVCKRCGVTRTYDGKILFDRRIANIGKVAGIGKKKRRMKNAKT